MSEQTPSAPDELPEQMRVRREKLDRLRAEGIDPYPPGFPRTSTIAAVRAAHPDLASDTFTGDRVGVTGRVMLSRIGGKLCFATIRDGSGDLQVMLSLDKLGAESLARWKSLVDLGDHVGIEGEVISSRAASCRYSPTRGRSPRRRSARSRTSTGVWPIPRPGCGNATST